MTKVQGSPFGPAYRRTLLRTGLVPLLLTPLTRLRRFSLWTQIALTAGMIPFLAVLSTGGAFAASLTLNGVGEGGCVNAGNSPSNMRLMTLRGSGFAPNSSATVSITSDQGDNFGSYTAPVDSQGNIIFAFLLWVSEPQIDTWVVTDTAGNTATLHVRAVNDDSCPVVPTETPTSTSSPTVTRTPTPTRTPTLTPTPTCPPTPTSKPSTPTPISGTNALTRTTHVPFAASTWCSP